MAVGVEPRALALMQADVDGLPSGRPMPDIPPPAVVRCTDQEWAFIRMLCADRLDGDTALVFADWLEENGRDAAGHRVRLLRPKPGDLLVVWPHGGVGEGWRPELPAVAAELARRHGIASWVVMSHPGQDIAAADPDQLRAAGWVRRDAVVSFLRGQAADLRCAAAQYDDPTVRMTEMARLVEIIAAAVGDGRRPEDTAP